MRVTCIIFEVLKFYRDISFNEKSRCWKFQLYMAIFCLDMLLWKVASISFFMQLNFKGKFALRRTFGGQWKLTYLKWKADFLHFWRTPIFALVKEENSWLWAKFMKMSKIWGYHFLALSDFLRKWLLMYFKLTLTLK